MALMALSLLFTAGCGRRKETSMAELIVGDWYTYNGVPYRSFSADGTVTGAENYTSPYTVDGNKITWNTAAGNEEVTLEFMTDGEILRISASYGGYFTTRRYYFKDSDGVEKGTGLPEKGTSDKGIFGSWYDGEDLFFTLNSDCSVSDCRDIDSFCFDGKKLVLYNSESFSDEAAECSLSGDTLTICYTDELTGEKAELVLTK